MKRQSNCNLATIQEISAPASIRNRRYFPAAFYLGLRASLLAAFVFAISLAASPVQGQIYWNGQEDYYTNGNNQGMWDLSTQNWEDSNGDLVLYSDVHNGGAGNQPVVFGYDSQYTENTFGDAINLTDIALNMTVAPTSVSFDVSNNPGYYSLQGTGGIIDSTDGPTSLHVSGSFGFGAMFIGTKNTYTGGTFIDGNIYFEVDSNGALGNGNVSLTNGAHLTFNNNTPNETNFNSNNNGYSPTGLTQSNGTLAVNLNGSMTVDTGSSVNLAGGGLTLSGSLSVTNSGVVDLDGDTQGTGGTLVVVGPLTLNTSGTLEIAGGNLTVGGLSGDATGRIQQTENNNSTTHTINIALAGGPYTFAGQIIDTGNDPLALNFSGSGTQILTGANAFTGGTTISGTAIVQISGASPLGSGAVAIHSGSFLDVRTATIAGLNDTGGGGGTVGTSSTSGSTQVLTLSPTGNSTDAFSGTIRDGGIGAGTAKVAVVVTGSGTQTLSGTNTYSGGTTVTGSGAVLKLGSNGAIPTGALTVANGGLVNLNGKSPTVASLSDGGSGTGTISSGSGGATLNISVGSGGLFTYSGSIANGAGTVALAISGSGTQVLSGANSYGAGTTVNGGGTLQVANTAGSATGSGSVDVGNVSGGTLAGSTASGQGFISGPVTIHSGGTIAESSGGSLSLGGGLTLQSGSFSTVTLFGAPTGATGASLINVTSGGISVSGTHTVTIAGAPQGTPAGVLYNLFGYTGTAPSLGSFIASGPAGFTYSFVANANQVDLKVVSTAPQLTWTGAAGSAGSGNWSTSAANWSPSNYSDGSAVTFDNSGTNTNVIVAATVSPQSVTFNNTTAVSYTIDSSSNPIAGSAYIVKNGNGMVALTGTNTFTGGTTIGAGTLSIDNDAALGAAPATPAVNLSFTGNSILQFTGDFTGTPLATTRTTIINTGVTAGFDTQANGVNYAGRISGGGALNKLGNGTLTLTGVNNYSGGTAIGNGTIVSGSNASLGSGPITLSGGTLALSTQPTITAGLLGKYYSGPTIAAGNPGNPAATYPFPSGTSSYTLVDSITSINVVFGSLTPTATANSTVGGFTHFSFAPGDFGVNSGDAADFGVTGHDFGGVWVGEFNAPTSGTYKFTTFGDDHSSFFIDPTNNGNYVLLGSTGQRQTQSGTTSITLSAGLHNVVIGYITRSDGGLSLSAQVSTVGSPVVGTNDIANASSLGQMGFVTASGGDYANSVFVTADSSINLGAFPAASFGPLSIGTAKLSLPGGGGTVTFGATTFTGGATFDVSNNGAVALGALGDNGTAYTINFNKAVSPNTGDHTARVGRKFDFGHDRQHQRRHDESQRGRRARLFGGADWPGQRQHGRQYDIESQRRPGAARFEQRDLGRRHGECQHA